MTDPEKIQDFILREQEWQLDALMTYYKFSSIIVEDDIDGDGTIVGYKAILSDALVRRVAITGRYILVHWSRSQGYFYRSDSEYLKEPDFLCFGYMP